MATKKKTHRKPRQDFPELKDIKPSDVKVRVNAWIDADVVRELKQRAQHTPGGKYQTLLNATLRQALFGANHVEGKNKITDFKRQPTEARVTILEKKVAALARALKKVP